MVAVLIEEGGAGGARWHSSSGATPATGMLGTVTGTWVGVSPALKERDLSHLLPDPSSMLERLEDAPGAVSPPASSTPPCSHAHCSSRQQQTLLCCLKTARRAGFEQKNLKLLSCWSLQLCLPLPVSISSPLPLSLTPCPLWPAPGS